MGVDFHAHYISALPMIFFQRHCQTAPPVASLPLISSVDHVGFHFDRFYALLAPYMQIARSFTAEDWQSSARAIYETLAQPQGLSAMELTHYFGPHPRCLQIWKHLLSGISALDKNFSLRLFAGLSRTHSLADNLAALRMLLDLLDLVDPIIEGIDFVGNETYHNRFSYYAALVREAKAAGLTVKVHWGENLKPSRWFDNLLFLRELISLDIDILVHCTVLAYGHHLLELGAVRQEKTVAAVIWDILDGIRAKKIRIQLCPSAAAIVSEAPPYLTTRFFEKFNIPIEFGTDNPVPFHTTLEREIALAHSGEV